MKKYFFIALVSLSACVQLLAAELSGDISFSPVVDKSMKGGFKKEFGDKVKVTTNFRTSDFFGKLIVNAGVSVKNTADVPMFGQVYVAFYDKDKKLMGAASQGTFGDKGMEPGKETQFGSMLIYLPKEKLASITSFSAVVYESEKPLGSLK